MNRNIINMLLGPTLSIGVVFTAAGVLAMHEDRYPLGISLLVCGGFMLGLYNSFKVTGYDQG